MSIDEVPKPLPLPGVSRFSRRFRLLFQPAGIEVLLPLAAEPAGDLLSSGEGR